MGPLEIIRTANHNLFRNKVRTFLTILAIFVGSFTIILNSAINAGVNSFIDEQTSSLGGEDFLMILPSGSEKLMSTMTATSGPQEFSEDETLTAAAFTDEQLNELKNMDGIDGDSFFSPQPISGTGYFTSSKNEKRWAIKRASIMPPGNFKIPLAAGTLTNDKSDKFQIVLEPDYPQALGYEKDEDILGETITVTLQNPITKEYRDFPIEVTGVEAHGLVTMSDGAYISHALYDAIYAFITEYYPEDYVAPTYYVMATFDTERFTESEIKEKLKDAGYLAMTMDDMMGLIRSFFDVIMTVFIIFGGIALLAAAIGIVNTLLMSVEERTREIGLNKALGMSSTKVFLSFSTEAILLGFWGSAFGVAVAYLIGTAVNAAVHAPGAFLEVFPTFELFRFTTENVLPIVIAVMIIAFIAGTAPASKAAHKNPINALRYE